MTPNTLPIFDILYFPAKKSLPSYPILQSPSGPVSHVFLSVHTIITLFLPGYCVNDLPLLEGETQLQRHNLSCSFIDP
jgi:hypothetical protein